MVQFKNKYMIFEVFLDPDGINREKEDPIRLTTSNVMKAIKDSFRLNFGECSLASALFSFNVKYVNPITKLCIIRCAREDQQKIWSAITMVRKIGPCPVVFNFLGLNGNIKTCKAAALKYEEIKFEQQKVILGPIRAESLAVEMHNNLARIKCLDG